MTDFDQSKKRLRIRIKTLIKHLPSLFNWSLASRKENTLIFDNCVFQKNINIDKNTKIKKGEFAETISVHLFMIPYTDKLLCATVCEIKYNEKLYFFIIEDIKELHLLHDKISTIAE
jgi:hypothetical protein